MTLYANRKRLAWHADAAASFGAYADAWIGDPFVVGPSVAIDFTTELNSNRVYSYDDVADVLLSRRNLNGVAADTAEWRALWLALPYSVTLSSIRLIVGRTKSVTLLPWSLFDAEADETEFIGEIYASLVIETSNDSTDGLDGTWTTALWTLTTEDNAIEGDDYIFDLEIDPPVAAATWIRIKVQGSPDPVFNGAPVAASGTIDATLRGLWLFATPNDPGLTFVSQDGLTDYDTTDRDSGEQAWFETDIYAHKIRNDSGGDLTLLTISEDTTVRNDAQIVEAGGLPLVGCFFSWTGEPGSWQRSLELAALVDGATSPEFWIRRMSGKLTSQIGDPEAVPLAMLITATSDEGAGGTLYDYHTSAATEMGAPTIDEITPIAGHAGTLVEIGGHNLGPYSVVGNAEANNARAVVGGQVTIGGRPCWIVEWRNSSLWIDSPSEVGDPDGPPIEQPAVVAALPLDIAPGVQPIKVVRLNDNWIE